jgi:flagellar hook protein FlgE
LKQDGYTTGSLVGIGVGSDGISGALQQWSDAGTGAGGARHLRQPERPAESRQQSVEPELGFRAGVASAPGTGGRGVIQSSAVEDSNVDLTNELVDMITAQRNYQANAQTIKTQDAIMQTLLNLR